MVQEQIIPFLRTDCLFEGSCPYHVPYYCKEHSTKKYDWYLPLQLQQMNRLSRQCCLAFLWACHVLRFAFALSSKQVLSRLHPVLYLHQQNQLCKAFEVKHPCHHSHNSGCVLILVQDSHCNLESSPLDYLTNFILHLDHGCYSPLAN